MNTASLQMIVLLTLLLPPLQAMTAPENSSQLEQEPLVLLNKPPKNSPLSTPSSPGSPGLQAPVPQMTGGQQELHDIYGPVSVPEPINYPLIAGIILLLIIIGLLTYLFFRKKQETAPPPIPPWDKALSDLIEARPLMTRERGLDYMNRVSLILRNYIETRFGIKSTRQTTREFLSCLDVKNSAGLKPFRAELQHCLEQADMAKFARHLSDSDNLMRVEEGITGFIKNTRPAPDQSGESR